MKRRNAFVVLVGIVCLVIETTTVRAQYQSPEAVTVEKATTVLNEFMTMPNQGIPRSMIQKAQAIVIVPGMIKLGFVVGGRRGKGIVAVRDESGGWRAPSFVTMTGGSVGFQAGVQSTDVILVFNSRNSVNNLLSGKFTIGVDAAAAAGPVGRQAAAATDGQLQAEIFSYSRSRGLFAGASVDGSVIQIDAAETQNYYRAAGMSADGMPVAPNAQLPLSAAQFLSALGTYSSATVVAPAAGPPGTLPEIAGSVTTTNPPANTTGTENVLQLGAVPGQQDPNAKSLEFTRQELAKSAQSLGSLLDESWRNYLALPQAVFSGQGVPTTTSLQQSLQRFDAVAKEGKYNLLLQRKEFQQTYGLLRTYLEQVESTVAPPNSPSADAAPATGTPAAIR